MSPSALVAAGAMELVAAAAADSLTVAPPPADRAAGEGNHFRN